MFTLKYVFGTQKLVFYSLIGKVKLSYDPFCWSVCRQLVGRSVCHNFLKRREHLFFNMLISIFVKYLSIALDTRSKIIVVSRAIRQ